MPEAWQAQTSRLQWVFALASLVVVVLLGIVVDLTLNAYIANAAVATAAQEAQADLSRLERVLRTVDLSQPLSDFDLARLRVHAERETPYLALIKVWSPDGRIAFATEKGLINQRFPFTTALRNALAGRTQAELSDLTQAENASERQLGLRNALEVYTPVRDAQGKVIGAFEIYRDAAPIVAELKGVRQILVGTLSAGLVLIWLCLLYLMLATTRQLRVRNAVLSALQSDLDTALSQLRATHEGTLRALSEAVEDKDAYTAGHVDRVSMYADLIGSELGLSAEERAQLTYAAILHDVGKVAVPDAILNKPGTLDEAERQIMMAHTTRGESILRKVPGMEAVARIVRHHHEHWSGEGYPDGLAGEAIPLGARIIAVADAFDAMTTDRIYRRALPYERALAELEAEANRQFDPRVTRALAQALERLHSGSKEAAVGQAKG